MKVPFTLHRAAHPGPATAVLPLSPDVAGLLSLCARVSADAGEAAREWPALPPVYAVSGGFLVKLGRPSTTAFPGTIRLRGLAPNLFLPADAELSPALLDDEAAGLVRDRGLIFLPGGRVLEFAPDRPLTADALLTLWHGHSCPCDPRPGRNARPTGWQPLPERPSRPDRLHEVLLDRPDDTSEVIFESGGEDIGVEEPRPADAGPMSKAAGQAALSAGRGLVWLGNLLHWRALASLGASLAADALQRVPRISESLLGRQEAALRELLRQFREGDLEKALRRALPLAGPGGRGGRPAESASLPMNNLFYRLADLLGGGRGSASVWFSSGDVHAELSREYRKAAEAATARGDYRRAAFIYGRLLQDYRLAAGVLARGGLHHDAAIIYLEMLSDTLAAAREFEAAGEADRALQLYQQRGEHALAGDLLRRLGEDEEAVRHYLLAADRLASTRNYLAAADLLFDRAGRSDLALRYLADGWTGRPHGSAVPCLLRLTRWYAEHDGRAELRNLVAEAEAFFAPSGNDVAAGQFFNALARVAERPNLADLRDELRDRALCGLAGKLRQEVAVRAGHTVSALLGQSGVWKAVVVSDADFAFKAALRKGDQPRRHVAQEGAGRVRLGTGEVTAVCAARASGRVFVGFANGYVACFDPVRQTVFAQPAWSPPGLVTALATDDCGERLLVLAAESPDRTVLISYDCSETSFSRRNWRKGPAGGVTWLTPIVERDGRIIAGLWEDGGLRILWVPNLLPLATIPPVADTPVQSALLFEPPASGENAGCLFLGRLAWWFGFSKGEPFAVDLGWNPGVQLRGLCSPPPLSWLWRGPHLQIAGIDADDHVQWTELYSRPPPDAVLDSSASPASASNRATTSSGGYRAAALLRPGLIAGVTPGGVEWLRRDGKSLVPRFMTAVSLPDVVACCPSLPTRELLVVCRDGFVVRVRMPN